VGEISERQDANDWTELEQGFFAAAPPDVAVEPPPAATFDDLSDEVFSRAPARKRTRTRQARRDRLVRHEDVPRATRVGEAVRTSGRILGGAVGGAARAAGRVVVWATARVFVEARRLAPVSRLTPQAVRRGLRALSERVAPEMPERPDAKTLAAGVTALLVVLGISASVLGSRGPRPVAAAPAPAVVAPVEAAPSHDPGPPPVAARPTMVLPQLEVVGEQPPAKHRHHHRRR
jgi:hypothetical protein